VAYDVELTTAALRQLRKLPRDGQRRIQAVIELLRETPRPPRCRLLKGKLSNLYRVRTGNYRVIYQVFDERLVICVVALRDRKDAYRR
jgi:mRNA interferase RelE/StbE